MPKEKNHTEAEKVSEKRRHGSQVRLKPAGEAQVKPQDNPVEPPPGKHIHARRPLPLVPEGPDDPEDANDREEDR
jgi:hypothetical protein